MFLEGRGDPCWGEKNVDNISMTLRNHCLLNDEILAKKIGCSEIVCLFKYFKLLPVMLFLLTWVQTDNKTNHILLIELGCLKANTSDSSQ